MILSLSQDYKAIKEILTDPILFGLTNGGVTTRDKFEVDTSYLYLLAKDDLGNIVGCVQMHEFNKTTMEIHLFVLPLYWKKGYVKSIAKLGHKWLKAQGYIKAFVRVPATCLHIQQCVVTNGYKSCGQIDKGIIFNGTLQTLFLYDIEL